jgi:soluble lytic murein transglycosylase-like protein
MVDAAAVQAADAPQANPETSSAEPETSPAPPEPVLPAGLAYEENVERWRGSVRTLLAEARAEGRVKGAAAHLDEDLILAVIQQESGGDPNARSWAGARGLMQLMPESFAWIMGIHDWGEDVSDVDPRFIYDPDTNLRAGIRFLAAVLEEQSGSTYWALSSYNAGGGVVNTWRANGHRAVPAWAGNEETANYAPAILTNYAFHRPDVTVTIPTPAPPPPAPALPAPAPVKPVQQAVWPAPAKPVIKPAPAPAKPPVRR